MLRRRRIAVLALALSLPMALLGLGQFAGLRVNFTPSYPLGVYRIAALRRPVAIGDVVFICPPPSAQFAMALSRGYLRQGLCAGGLSPLIKKVVAIGGQAIRIGVIVTIEGTLLSHSEIHRADAAGRPLRHWSGGVVPSGQVFLHSDFAGSYDSRYFGPVSASGILGRAVPVLTFAG